MRVETGWIQTEHCCKQYLGSTFGSRYYFRVSWRGSVCMREDPKYIAKSCGTVVQYVENMSEDERAVVRRIY